jgi:DNA (cytosine-5)-methyltransferase 1
VNYYNEIDPFAAQWLRNLIADGLIPPGDVDQRSIKEVQPDDVRGYDQWHFFAGIGGWAEALRLAGWPRDVRVCTGSCPCQPLSCAGKHEGEMDERHLWPDFYRIIAELRPPVVFGEQVASNDGLEWLDGISLDLEELDYAFGAADLPAAGVKAPHGRHRFFWVADAGINEGRERHDSAMQRRRSQQAEQAGMGGCNSNRVGNANGERFDGESVRLLAGRPQQAGAEIAGAGEGYWDEYRIVRSGAGELRRAEPGTFPMAYGLPASVESVRPELAELGASARACCRGQLAGFGNAIVPQVAAKFIRAYLEAAT